MDFLINETSADGYSPYEILLDDTPELNSIADCIQRKKGNLPLFDDSGEYDDQNWYDFYLRCNLDQVNGMYFEYGISGEYCDEIPMTDKEREEAYAKVLDFFGGYGEYKRYILDYEGVA